MDVILDTNIYFTDLRMEGNQFQELFVYLRRKGSRLVIPKPVSVELFARYRDKLAAEVPKATRAWEALRKIAIIELEDLAVPDIDEQAVALLTKLHSPARGVEVVRYDNLAQVDVLEIVARGAERIRPANPNGEELRDVILWLVVLQYAKKRGTEVAFISGDSTFANSAGNALHERLVSDVAKWGVRLSFYRGIGAFIALNSIEAEPVEEEWLWKFVEHDVIESEARSHLSEWGGFRGTVQNVNINALGFASGTKYRVDEDAFYAEVRFEGVAMLAVQEWNYFNLVATVPHSGSDLQLSDYYLQTTVVPAHPRAEALLWPRVEQNNLASLSPKEMVIRCEFELEVSVRTAKDKLVAFQADRFKTIKAEPVAHLDAN